MKNSILRSTRAVSSGLAVASPVLPGAALVSAATLPLDEALTPPVTPTGAGSGVDDMMLATRELTELQANFNLQYLQIQQEVQQDTRQFSLVSNLMKTKHEAAKNALSNIR